ncbi:hypothetical protein [Pseudoroseicyclus aestuarii]|uniref:DUF7742 domain-containing protein n=1 Tax=Pseudoroseicyclus aestuarii TaxID=1795041 RepID=A0A318SZ96_9RHOB|nr:hypothetical protein [Pseudoroseicyclus aestuarii]PYE85726.1 hypothetical protein DFP88_101396 [Pseudoroseicyclus aestuarii]
MRPLLPGDMDQAVRALLAVPEARRAALAGRLILRAHAADKWRKRLRRPHPLWGDGSLMAASMRAPQAGWRGRFDADWCAALAVLLAALAEWRRR